jgi:hypothetical protein
MGGHLFRGAVDLASLGLPAGASLTVEVALVDTAGNKTERVLGPVKLQD